MKASDACYICISSGSCDSNIWRHLANLDTFSSGNNLQTKTKLSWQEQWHQQKQLPWLIEIFPVDFYQWFHFLPQLLFYLSSQNIFSFISLPVIPTDLFHFFKHKLTKENSKGVRLSQKQHFHLCPFCSLLYHHHWWLLIALPCWSLVSRNTSAMRKRFYSPLPSVTYKLMPLCCCWCLTAGVMQFYSSPLSTQNELYNLGTTENWGIYTDIYIYTHTYMHIYTYI